MNEIHILDTNTIDQIAAGEVVERPSCVVKELVENAIDAGAAHITVEIKEGGTTFIRVTDDGCGIDKSQLDKVFLRHATSKIKAAADLETVMSLGFRGEALSSIAAVCQVELMTKTPEALTGFRMCVGGGEMEPPEEAGLPDGTTVVVRNIFFNTPVRRKFLKTPQTEGSYITDVMQHIALSKPDIAIQFIINGQTKFYTAGNGDMKEIVYRIYGKDVAQQLIELEASGDGMTIKGFLGKPILNRSNRSYETFFVNGRYIKSSLISSAVEEGYRTFLMQHKYPFVILHLNVDPTRIDVNVHPTKMDIRINNPVKVLEFIRQTVKDGITGKSLVQPMEAKPFAKQEQAKEKEKQLTKQIPQPFEQMRLQEESPSMVREPGSAYRADAKADDGVLSTAAQQEKSPEPEKQHISVKKILGAPAHPLQDDARHAPSAGISRGNIIKQRETVLLEKPQQMALFEEDDLRRQEAADFRIVGQVFDTYWILTFANKLYYVDQHAAHEKVMYERLMRHYREKEIPVQQLNPPVVVNVSPKEAQALAEHRETFEALGFEIEEFGEDAYALRAVPMDLYGCQEKELFLEVLDELVALPVKRDADAVLMKIASMSCKAAVKGNMEISLQEAQALIEELFACENPYNCPHGRPTVISMTRYELEKKFKR